MGSAAVHVKKRSSWDWARGGSAVAVIALGCLTWSGRNLGFEELPKTESDTFYAIVWRTMSPNEKPS